jgi:hypothetical protein
MCTAAVTSSAVNIANESMSTKNEILPKPFTLRAVLLRLCFANLSPSEKALKAVRKFCFFV